MPLTVVTGWGRTCWHKYAHYFVETFKRFWPADVPLVAYVEEGDPVIALYATIRALGSCEGAIEFIERHGDIPERNGTAPTPAWESKHKLSGYNFRFDAVKFSRQGFIPYHAALAAETEYLVWFDADVVFTRKIDPREIVRLLPADKHIAYIGRLKYHPDIGFQLYRLPQALPFLKLFRDFYASDEVFKLPEWHSAYVWREALVRSGIASLNLTPDAIGDAWAGSPLGTFSVHRKGKRKDQPWIGTAA